MTTYEFGTYRYTQTGLLWEADRLVGLTPLQRRMLHCFCRQPRELLSKAALIDQVWRRHDVSELSLARSVHGLRCKFGNARKGAELIRNVYGEGYIFTPAVELVEDATATHTEMALIG